MLFIVENGCLYSNLDTWLFQKPQQRLLTPIFLSLKGPWSTNGVAHHFLLASVSISNLYNGNDILIFWPYHT